MAGGLIDEIFIALGIKVDATELKPFETKVRQAIRTVSGFGIAILATATALDRMSNSLFKNNQQFINFNRQTGISIDNMQKIVQAGLLADFNLNPQTIMDSIQALQSNLAKIRLGQGNIAPFQLLGINPVGSNALQVIDDLRDRIKGLDDATAVNLIQQLGLSPQFISILRLTNEEFNKMNNLMLSGKQRHELNQYSAGLRKIHLELNLFKDRALILILKPLNQFLGGLTAIIRLVVKFAEGIGFVLDKIGRLKTVLGALALGITAYFNPVLAIMSAIYLLIEDIAVWASGGKSALGTTFDIISDKIKGMTSSLQEFLHLTKNLPSQSLALSAVTPNVNGGSRTINQNNYMSFPNVDAKSIAKKTNELQFAYMQLDRTV